MTAKPWYCESELHEGPRLITSIYDRVERRIEYRKVIDQSRMRTVVEAHVCTGCVERELLMRSMLAHPAQGTQTSLV